MIRNLTLSFLFLFPILMNAQFSVSGNVKDNKGNVIDFATVALLKIGDKSLVKAEMSDENGAFKITNLANDTFNLQISYVGFEDYTSQAIIVNGQDVSLNDIIMQTNTELIEEVVVVAKRPLLEVKPDRTVFNVQGTINSTGDDGFNLLRKAPGVMVDNNNNITVLGRSGVIVYIDGKRLPLSGEELSSYLQNIPSDQIDKIEIITSPGAKYEAQGNAGIIDIRLKKSDLVGSNATISLTGSKGKKAQGNGNINYNYRNSKMNIFANTGYNLGERWNNMRFDSYQNGFRIKEDNLMENGYSNFDFRLGTDFFISSKSTLGFLVSGNLNENDGKNVSDNEIHTATTSNVIDSVLIARNTSNGERDNFTYNLNYAFTDKQKTFNIDFDHGSYKNDNFTDQPNIYYEPDRATIRTAKYSNYQTPVDIKISSVKFDFGNKIWKGTYGIGYKYSDVRTDNLFQFNDIIDGVEIQNNQRSNRFNYDEKVHAGYINYTSAMQSKMNFSAGLRVENSDIYGDLTAFDPSLQEPPVDTNYISFFPSAGLTYQITPMKQLSLNYGRRINRPDYQVLNPFREQLSELGFSKGNEKLRPEIVNNLELAYSLNYMYRFSLGYSKTTDQITRLIGPDDVNPKAGFITWENLATQKLYNFSISAPFDIKKWWNLYVNFGANYTDNRADYGENGVVDVQAYNYSIYQQQTFSLKNGLKLECSGWFSGPGVWGGVFLFDPSYSLNFGAQKRFLKDKLNVRLSVNDIFFQSGWSGYSNFNGLNSKGGGNWDSRRASISLSYQMGNVKVKSRDRKTGIENESKRVGG